MRLQLSKINYEQILDDAWQDHLVQKHQDAPTVISTFAGCGGSSLGYSMTGSRELLAVEWDDNAAETFRLNFPDVPLYHGDIAALSVEECLERTGLVPGGLDVLDGSPPCQGFSLAGKRNFADDRNQLFREYVRLLRGLKPKVFVMENVPGMVKGKMKAIFVEILNELKSSGYNVKARTLNSKYFGVPQSRERLIFIGTRNDLNIEPSHPLPQSIPITVRVALTDVSPCEVPLPTVPDRMANVMAACKPGRSVSDSFKIASYYNYIRLAWDRPSNTIPKSVLYSTHASHWHPSEDRPCTIRELARLGSFPDQFQFVGDYKDRVARIGNSVPPLFMRAFALHIKEQVLV